MLRPRIIPCLLMRNGGLYKTRQFADAKYVGDPLNAVKIFNEKEVDELMLLDIGSGGTRIGDRPNFKLLEKLAVESRMPMCYGGGVLDAQQAMRIINMGYEKVSISTAALERPAIISEMADAVGSQSVVVTLDVRSCAGRHVVYKYNGHDGVSRELYDLCDEFVSRGAGEFVFNSIDRDGMMCGYDLRLAASVTSRYEIPLTFLGGAGSVDHMGELVRTCGIVGVAAGSMFVFKGKLRAVLISYQRPIV